MFLTFHISRSLCYGISKIEMCSKIADTAQISSVTINSPKLGHWAYVAGQKRKFEDRVTAENYLNGRIHAYAKYFSDLSPSIPEKYKMFFMESGRVLPGYRIEGQEQQLKKPSVLNQLSEAKSQQKAAPATPSKNKKEPEL